MTSLACFSADGIVLKSLAITTVLRIISLILGTDGQCSPRHGMSFSSGNKGSKCV